MTPEFSRWLSIGSAYGVGAASPLHPRHAAAALPSGFGYGAQPTTSADAFGGNFGGWAMGPDCPPSDPLCSGSTWGGDVVYPMATVSGASDRVVPLEQVQAFDALVRQYTTDVNAWKAKGPTPKPAIPAMTSGVSQEAINDFWIRWDTFQAVHAANMAKIGANGNAPPLMPAGIYGDENVAMYERNQAAFNELVRQGKAVGVATTVEQATNVSPFERATAAVGTEAATWAKWIFGAALVLGLAYVAGPAVAALAVRRAVGAP